MNSAYVLPFEKLNLNDLEAVGGKNASLGEMITNLSQLGIQVPTGVATTVQAYREFLQQNDLDKKIAASLSQLDVNNIEQLRKVSAEIRQSILDTEFLPEFKQAIEAAVNQLTSQNENISFAVRSSATAEDLPNASFAGQQETYLNVSGLDNILIAIKKVFASLYTDRAIAYRIHQGFPHDKVGLSCGIQRMIRSDKACSGVMFSIDTESGFDQVVFITGAYGLGETVVQGEVNPDEFYVYKPALNNDQSAILRRHCGSKQTKMVYADEQAEQAVKTIKVDPNDCQQFCITDDEATLLAQYAVKIEQHYGCAMDIEWAKDGLDNQLYIVQARPETVQQQANTNVIKRYQLKERVEPIATGRSIGQGIGQGTARLLKSIDEMDSLNPGDVLVTDMTDPDWEPIMKRASAIVTNRGGRTCHAAIIARELGIPAIVGCGDATQIIQDNSPVTVSCAEGDTGFIYPELLPFAIHEVTLDDMPDIPFKIMMNVGNPDMAFGFQKLPNAGVGLARLEFIINKMIGIHPQALLQFDTLKPELKEKVRARIAAYASPTEYYIERLKEGIATIAAAFYPQPVIVRLSDFKSNEYANLLGGDVFEPDEENPMLGFRGASRYLAESFRPCFDMECEAIKRARNEMGLTNIQIMIPFVRTLTEAEGVINLLKTNELKSGENDLKIIMMCELPSNALLAEKFLKYFDGFSIGSNDLTQLTLGLDRDSGIIAELFDERDPAVKLLLAKAINACRQTNKYIGICGQGPSDHPDLAQWLVEQGIDSVSLNPDTVLDTWLFLANKK